MANRLQSYPLLLSMECAQLERVLKPALGDYLVQIGGLPALSDSSSIRHKYYFSSQLMPDAILIDLDEIPLARNSIDVLIVVHILEFRSRPQVFLKELYKILAPGGQLIIIDLNPWSLWGLKHAISPDQDPSWNGRFWSAWKVKHWLRGIGFRIITSDTFGFRPPLQKISWWRGLLWMEAFGSFCCPALGGFYLITAQKRGQRMVAIPRTVWSKKLAGNRCLEPTTRASSVCPDSK